MRRKARFFLVSLSGGWTMSEDVAGLLNRVQRRGAGFLRGRAKEEMGVCGHAWRGLRRSGW